MTGSSAEVEHLISTAHTGSSEALGQLLESCRAYLLLVARQEFNTNLQAKGSPSDLVQQTFLEAQRDFDSFGGHTAAELRAWLRQLLLHNLADFSRHHRDTDKRQAGREVPLSDDHPSGHPGRGLVADMPSPSAEAQEHEQAQALREALGRLPEDYRAVLQLRYQEERPFEEIAQLLQRSANAVRKLWARASERLQQEMRGPREPRER